MRKGPEEGFICCLARSRQGRRLGLAGALFAAALIAASPAAGQTGTTTSTTTTTPVPGAPVGEPRRYRRTSRRSCPGGKASVPAGAPGAVVRAIKAANKIHRRTYIWGGGHRSFRAKGYDCSGAVSYVLHAAGVLSSPLVSGQLAFLGLTGPRQLDHRVRQPDATPTW